MNGKTTIPTRTWKEEYTKLTAERKTLNQRYLALKEEVKEAEKIRESVYSILRQEQREQLPHRKQDMERLFSVSGEDRTGEGGALPDRSVPADENR